MCGGVRVDHEALHVGDVGKQAEDFQVVDELESFFLAALDVEREDGTATIREVLLVEFVVRMVREARVAHAGNLRVLGEVFQDLLGVFHVAIQAERKRFDTLQQQECVERRNGSTFIAEEDSADVDGISRCARRGERNAVARVLLGELRELAAGSPVELAAIHDDAAESRTVTADELGRRMHNHVGTVFNWANQVRRTEGVVDNQRTLVLVGNRRDGVDIRNVGMRVAERFDEDELRVALDCGFDTLEIVRVDERGLDTEGAERMLQQVESTAINRALGNHVIALASESRDGVGNGSCTRSDSESGDASFEGSDTFFEHTLSGVIDTAINVTASLQNEAVGGVLGIVEHVRGGLVNRNCAGIGCGVCGFLANVELKSLEMKLVLCRHG